MAKEITPQGQDYSQWYNDLVLKAGLAEHSAVKGCMVIKPYGYAIWEKMKEILDKKFKETGHVNAAFPLFIPKNFLSKEAAHVDGFAKECAVVTHYRLKNDPNGGGIVVDPEAKLEEELIVRPTSETIIWSTYKNWINSYRDLPLLINQWANVVRWEMRTRLFLRTTEFFWQEGHTAHETAQEAQVETQKMLDIYASFMYDYMAVPVIKGVKSAGERFAGAVDTYTLEGLMQDGKALQMGTSHFLGQNFAKAFEVKFKNKKNNDEYVWATSWGVSTRLMGALIMSHSDDEGLVLPPRLAPLQVVIIPICTTEQQLYNIKSHLSEFIDFCNNENITYKIDSDLKSSAGWKFAEYEMKGVPIRLALGGRDMDNGTIEIVRRDTREKKTIPFVALNNYVKKLLIEIQENLLYRATLRRDDGTHDVASWQEFTDILENKGGFIRAFWDGTQETEDKVKELTKATIRCIPLDQEEEVGIDPLSGKPANIKVLYAKAY